MMALRAAFNLPFIEQIAFFRRKVNIPTRRWDDLWQGQHAHGFMVAGAMKADLLSDLREAVEKAIEGGSTLADFRGEFDDIVERHGWSYKGGRDWRTRVIYDTNVRTSHAAGRWKQLQDPDVNRFYGYMVYRHGDSRDPRPEHLAWDGLVLPADDPWWNDHYPPNGWGCKCRVFAATLEEYEAAGSPQAPPSPIDPKTGAPVGIDPGWAYTVGQAAARETEDVLAEKLQSLPPDIAARARQEITALMERARSGQI